MTLQHRTARTVTTGMSYPLGATLVPDGVNFAIYSKHATQVFLLLFDQSNGKPTDVIEMKHCEKFTWHCLVHDIRPGQVTAPPPGGSGASGAGRATRVRSRALAPDTSGILVEVAARDAGWRYVSFAVRQIAARDTWIGETGGDELCLVLLAGACRVRWAGGAGMLGPRGGVFGGYPHAVYLPPATSFTIDADERAQIAEGRAPATERHAARVIRPDDCGFEIRGGGNATRQIVDIMPPSFPAHRLLVCEVYTPSGNWSSYPPHKHDTDNPPAEVALEETYYYRFRERDAYGIQRLYEPDDRNDEALTVRDGDLVLIRRGYHPFVSAHGYDAYYLNVLAGDRRSMAASDDPRYASFRQHWPAPDPRVPTVQPPRAVAR